MLIRPNTRVIEIKEALANLDTDAGELYREAQVPAKDLKLLYASNEKLVEEINKINS